MKENNFDLIVIGAGSGGLGASLGMHFLGAKVLLIDKSAGRIGGECLNTGCVPSKALVHVSKLVHSAKKAEKFGLIHDGKVEMQKVRQYIKERQSQIAAHENVSYLRDQGLHIVLGTAHFVGQREVEVNGEVFQGKNIVIATGSVPRRIEIPGSANTPIYTNDSIFEIENIPEHFLFLGGGPVSVELGQAFSRLGSKVTIIDQGARILKKEDELISKTLEEQLMLEGIHFRYHSELKSITQKKEALVQQKDGKETKQPVDAIFMGLGRALNFDSLHLEKAGIDTKDGKITVNKYLQTSNRHVYVVGDAADAMKFSHAAELHNTLVITNFVTPLKKKLNFDHFGWVTFTDPEVATFGFTEKELRDRGVQYERLDQDFAELDRAVTDDFRYGKLVLFAEKKRFNSGNAKLLGGSMIAPNAGELMQEAVLVNTEGLTLSSFTDKVYAYPTAGNILKSTVRTRISDDIKPWMKRILLWWYRLRN